MSSKTMNFFELPDPKRLPYPECDSGVPSWDRTPGQLTARELEILQAIDPDLAHSFNNADFMALYETPDVPLAPQASFDPTYAHVPRTEGAPTEKEEDIEASLLAIQKQLDLLTAAKEIKESKRGKEGNEEPDAADILLAHGLRALLRKVMALNGPSKFIGVFIKFDQLTFKARAAQGTSVIPTIGSKLVQLLTFWRRFQNTQEKFILNNVTGSFRPSRTCLILGPPRSGKSTLMKAISGRLHEGHSTKLQGVVEYAGLRLREKQPKDGIKLVKLVGYVPQVDEHMPTLTVRETANFARACVSQPPPKILAQEHLGEAEMRDVTLLNRVNVEMILSMLGIRHVGDTVVGNAMLRGISGGQRKRLTTAEIMVTHMPVLMMDEISTGLDSATTFEICTALKSIARCLKANIVVSLLQPTPETYSTFDEVLVMSAGQIAYLGPRHAVLPYFMELGFKCPEGKDAAEFLQEVTLPMGMEKYRMPGVQPRCVVTKSEDFGPAWQSSRQFQQRLEEDKALEEHSKYELSCLPANSFIHHKLTSNFTQNAFKMMQLCLERQAILNIRNVPMIMQRIMQVIVGGLLLGSLFFQISLDDYNSKYSVMYFALLFVSVTGFAMMPGIVEERRVVYRQTGSNFFHPLPYSIASNIVDIPLTVVETFIFMIIVYWMCGLSSSATDFLGAVLSVLLTKLTMNGLFRVLANLAPTEAIAPAFGAVMLALYVLHSGFFLAYSDIKKYYIWVYWINPMQYGMTTMALNEFRASKYAVLRNPADPSLGTWGDFYLSVKGMPQDDSRVYLGWVFNCCYYILMVILNTLILSYIRYSPKFPAEPPEPTEGLKLNDAEPMPFIPCTLAWKAINYDVDIPGKKGKEAKLGLRLLESVSGFAKPGTMTALMGSSGAGKTTLLDVLAGRKNTGRVAGEILLNGQVADPVTFSRVSGYVEQMDIHSQSITVEESLRFSALLRLPRETPDAEKEAFVWQVISMLNLQQIANCAIGNRQNGLSVEQVKRVTIGVEMVANPSVLFLDEPTSGLDSMAADIVMDALKAVAASGRTLICTIHQPSSYLFNMFAHLLLLTRGGKTVFFGETGHNSCKLVEYFNSIPGVPQHDGDQNPATWMLNALTTEGIKFDQEYRDSGLCAENEEELQAAMQATGEQLTSGHLYQAPVARQFWLLQHKWFRLQWRSPTYNLARTATTIVVALLLGSIFFQASMDSQQGVFTLVGLQFMVLLFIGILFANTMQGLIEAERTVFYREKAAHMYRPPLMNLAMGFAEFPYITFNCILLTVIYYFMVGLQNDATVFFTWFLVFWLFVLYFAYLGMFLGCVLPNAEAASAVSGAVTSFGSLLCGFMLPKDSIPWWWRWLYYLNPMTYAVQAIVSSQFYCETADKDPVNFGNCPSFAKQNIDGTSTVVSVWGYLKDYFNLDYEDRWLYIGALAISIFLTRFFCSLALSFVNHAKR